MIDIIDFNQCKETARTYGGNAGRKVSMLYNDKLWLVKYPGNLKSIKDVALSYSTSPISEYIGSHVYQLLGIPAHNTVLGMLDGKIVVGCEDFCGNEYLLSEFKTFKVTYRNDDDSPTDGDGTRLSDVLNVLDNHPALRWDTSVKKRFWDMFVVDAFIGNPDRNNGNWGFLVTFPDRNLMGLAPVYDNGNCLNCKWDDNRMKNLIKNASKPRKISNLSKSVYLDCNDVKIYPFDYIENTDNKDCIKSYIDIYEKIDLRKIRSLISDIYDQGLITEQRKEFYDVLLTARYELVMKGLYDRLNESPILDCFKSDDIGPRF